MLLPSHEGRRVLHHGWQCTATRALGVLLCLAEATGCALEEPNGRGTMTASYFPPAPSALNDLNTAPPSVQISLGTVFGSAGTPPAAPQSVRSEALPRLATHDGVSGLSPAGRSRSESLRLPPFSGEGYSAGVPNARSFAIGRKGVVFVSTRDDDNVYALIDADGDRRVERVQIVASGLDAPNGVVYRDGALYVAETTRILRIDGIDEHLENPPERGGATDRLLHQHHGWRYIRLGPDGWLYIPIDVPCTACLRDGRGVSESRMRDLQPGVSRDLASPTFG